MQAPTMCSVSTGVMASELERIKCRLFVNKLSLVN